MYKSPSFGPLPKFKLLLIFAAGALQKMPLKQAAWTHGLAVQLESTSWSALRQGFFTTVRPSNESTSAWFHFAIPTPVIVNDVLLKADSALVRFATGNQTKIGAIHVYDGERRIAEYNGTTYRGALQLVRVQIPGSPEIAWGTGISILVVCDGTGPDAWAQLVSAGIDFY